MDADESRGTAQDRADGNDPLDLAREAIEQSGRLAAGITALVRAELRLARSSAFTLIWLAGALIVFAVGAWLATNAAIAAGVYALTGSFFVGVASVALANLLGIAISLWLARSCWRDLGMPRTRRAIHEMAEGIS